MKKIVDVLFLLFLLFESYYLQDFNPQVPPVPAGGFFDSAQTKCNADPISYTHWIRNNAYSAPCLNCTPSNDSVIYSTMVFPAQAGTVFCMYLTNQSEFNDTNQFSTNVPVAISASFTDMNIMYSVTEAYVGAANVIFQDKCFCHCPGEPLSGQKCFQGFDYCGENNLCINFFQDGEFSDCPGSNIGFLSQASRSCCSFDFSLHNEAQFYYITSPIQIVSNALVAAYFNYKSSPTTLSSQKTPVIQYTFFPPGQPLAFNLPYDINCNNNTGDLFCQPAVNWTLSNLGTFEFETFPGREMIAIYQGRIYYVPFANRIGEFDPTKCGWLKKQGNGSHTYDKIAIANSFDLYVNSCRDDSFTGISRVSRCPTSDWILLADQLAPFGTFNETENINLIQQQGFFKMNSTTPFTSLMVLKTNQNYYTVSYTYSVNSANCSGSKNFQSATVTCDLSYTAGSSHAIVSLMDLTGDLIFSQNVILDGSGLQTVTFSVPSSTIIKTQQLCFNSNNYIPKCVNISLAGNDLVVKAPNWNTRITDHSVEPSSTGTGFNFFDWHTWADNVWRTILAFAIIFIILLVIIGLITLAALFGPYWYKRYTIFYNLMKAKRENKRLLKAGYQEAGQVNDL